MSLISRQRLSFGLMHGEWLISSGGRAQVKCTEREFEQNRFATQQHRSLMQQMADSAFCLIMPGNSQSSQRLTEAFLTGCIPRLHRAALALSAPHPEGAPGLLREEAPALS